MIISRLTNRERKIFYVCLALGLTYFGYNFIYKPFLGSENELNEKIAKARKKLIKNNNIIQTAKENEKVYEQYQAEFKQTQTNDQTISVLISNIEKEASQIGLAIADIKPKPVRQDKFFNSFSVSLSIEGKWTDILQLIHVLQQHPYLYSVDEMSLDRASQRNTDFIRAYLVLSRMYLP